MKGIRQGYCKKKKIEKHKIMNRQKLFSGNRKKGRESRQPEYLDEMREPFFTWKKAWNVIRILIVCLVVGGLLGIVLGECSKMCN